MLNQFNLLLKKNEFTTAWLIMAMLMIMQMSYIVLCHTLGSDIQQAINQDHRILIRTIFYVLAIATFPLTTLIRYILVRLNQTMSGHKTAQQRYLVSVIVSFAMMETLGIFGFIMFILGDDYNTLYIFSGLAILGFFLQRPKQEEYQAIVAALKNR